MSRLAELSYQLDDEMRVMSPDELVELVGLLRAEIERLKAHIKDKDTLLVCYRVGKRPSEKLLDRLAKWDKAEAEKEDE